LSITPIVTNVLIQFGCNVTCTFWGRDPYSEITGVHKRLAVVPLNSLLSTVTMLLTEAVCQTCIKNCGQTGFGHNS